MYIVIAKINHVRIELSALALSLFRLKFTVVVRKPNLVVLTVAISAVIFCRSMRFVIYRS